jgi:hypothetical protein
MANEPELQPAALIVAKQHHPDAEPMQWALRANGQFVVILTTGAKIVLPAVPEPEHEAKAAPAKAKTTSPKKGKSK